MRPFYLRLTPLPTKLALRGDNENVTRKGLPIALLASVAALAAPALGARPLPASVSGYLLGPKLIRAEIVVKLNGLHDYRLDRGKLLKRYSAGSLNLLERDGTKTPVKVAPWARVILNGN